jgi:hypothetical protein
MSAISLTAAQIRAMQANGAVVRPYDAGEELTIGNCVYINTDGDVAQADANAVASARGIGIVVEGIGSETTINSGERCSVCVFGPVSGFSSMTPGANAYVSDTAGGLDTAAGTCSRIMGYVERDGVLFVHPEQNDPSST